MASFSVPLNYSQSRHLSTARLCEQLINKKVPVVEGFFQPRLHTDSSVVTMDLLVSCQPPASKKNTAHSIFIAIYMILYPS